MRAGVPVFSASFVFAISAACGGQTQGGGSPGLPAGLVESPSTTPPFAASDVTSARATCGAPHGPVDPYASRRQLGDKLVGAWLHCDPDPNADPQWAGIEFTADGKVYVLIDDGSGGLGRGLGIDSEGRWDIRVYGSQENQLPDDTVDPNASFYLDIYGAGAAASPIPRFETNPRRLDYDEALSKWFVPLEHP